ncbi:MAG TPA: phosphoribosylformylglycinamidine synthase subunit PurS [Gaiellales bacterium]|nr:phosphoribosylformylglycinamidine synthase subunit PurS [Gaiellales bacterium]
MRVVVTVRPRAGILDPQGEALLRSLRGLGHSVSEVRVGKLFDVDIDAGSSVEAAAIAREIAAGVLSNPLIEDFDVAVAEDAAV